MPRITSRKSEGLTMASVRNRVPTSSFGVGAMRIVNRVASAESVYKSIPKPSDGNGWYKIKNLVGGAGHSEIYLYDEIGLWGITASDFVYELQALEALHIDLRINSPGGDVWDGIAIYNALCNHPASVTSYVDGIAASSASFIAQAGGKVVVARNGIMIIHDAEGVCIGNAAEMTEMAELLDRTSNNIADIYAQRCSTVNVWRKAMKNMTCYVGSEAVDSGLADEVYEPDQGTEGEPAERRRRATAKVDSAGKSRNQTRVPKSIGPMHPVRNTEPDDGVGSGNSISASDGTGQTNNASRSSDSQDGTATTTTTTDVTDAPTETVTPPPDEEDITSWWDPNVFKTALATAADQHDLYGFDAGQFREIMRSVANDCPMPNAVVKENEPTPEPVRVVSQSEFLEALRRGLI